MRKDTHNSLCLCYSQLRVSEGEKRHTPPVGNASSRKDIHNCLCLCYSQLRVSVGEKRHTQFLVSTHLQHYNSKHPLHTCNTTILKKNYTSATLQY